MSGITINDQYMQFAQQVASDAISTLSNALQEMRNPALQVAERWSILANAYQNVFDSAFNKAVFYRGMAELAGNGPGTEGWQRIADSARELLCKKARSPIAPLQRWLPTTIWRAWLAGPVRWRLPPTAANWLERCSPEIGTKSARSALESCWGLSPDG